MNRSENFAVLARALCVLVLALCTDSALAQTASDVSVGHWIEVKGTFEQGRFFAESVEIVEPSDRESIIGTVTEVAEDSSYFVILDRRISVSGSTTWRDVSPKELLGARVKVEGHYRGPRKFSSRKVSRRNPGRERLSGRVDDKRRVDSVEELRVMNFVVSTPRELAIRHELPLRRYTIAPALLERADARPTVRRRDDDKNIPVTLNLGDEVSVGLIIDWEGLHQDNFNLTGGDRANRSDNRFGLRGELIWQPNDRFYGLAGFRYQKLYRDEEDDGYSTPDDSQLREAFGYLRDAGIQGLDLQVGRQDFDEDREWLYDQILDAVRVHYTREFWQMELSASTTLADGSPRNEGTDNLLGYVSNRDEDRHLAAYVLDRRDSRTGRDYPIHFGMRAIGEWIPDHDIWFEGSVLQGYTDDTDLRGYGLDFGTTWSPDFLGRAYMNVGYAFGSGDATRGSGRDRNFRQTGLQDNTDKLGGVTSLKYYGELLDPELSNMGILTLGIGTRIGKRNSLDLLYHSYRQDEAASFLLDTDIDRRPTGLDPDLGWELDLVFGSRTHKMLDVEFVLAAFEPGAAFVQQETAYLVKIQLRWKL
ncbi:MAG: alginate production protein [Chlamydiales bacterium]|jgi:alginate production protein